ncbi:MAG: anti-sigma factor antagonist [Eubacteriales bacterium]|nr:anti-sigma factor antagonist [Eubacteriales bacterium]
MKSEMKNGALVVFPEGRIDSTNASAVECEIEAIRAANPAEELILDLDALEYISSAGLRVVLRLRKETAALKLINASSEVYEIFDMTGFTEMVTVEKAYRKFSVEGCEVIGRGSNGMVYRLDADTIIKVYFDADALPDIQRERELARKAFVLGIPTAIPYDVARVGDSYGSVFELLNAKSFAELIVAEPENKDKYIEMDVDLLKKIHATEVKPGDMPNMKEVTLKWAESLRGHLPEKDYEKLTALIVAVPENYHMMHGDYHVKNVMMQNGEVLLIDMDTLCYGDPVFEFASIFLAYLGFAELDHEVTQKFLGIDYSLATEIWDKTLRLYFGTEDETVLRANADKAKIIGYTRLMRRTIRRIGSDDPEGKAIIENCRAKLAELLGRVDTLCFETC